MTLFEWSIIAVTVLGLTGGAISWMVHVSVAVGKIVAELHAINDKLGGHLDWIKSLDAKVDDHERRIGKLEHTCDTQGSR